MKRENLVVVRAGDTSLHEGWLEGDGPRNWDLLVNYYGDDKELYRTDDVIRIDSKGPKWPSIKSLMSDHPETIEGYDYIWLPDDDVIVSKNDINRIFDTCRQYSLEIAQPSLSPDSYFSHIFTLQNKSFFMRYTNFIEVMAPCFSNKMLFKSLDLFDRSLSGWGMDFVWSKIAENPDRGIAIIDAIAITHTRPIGGPNYKFLQQKRISPWDEMRALCAAYGFDETPSLIVHSAIFYDGAPVDRMNRERLFDFHVIFGYMKIINRTKNPAYTIRKICALCCSAAFNTPLRLQEVSILRRCFAPVADRLGIRRSG